MSETVDESKGMASVMPLSFDSSNYFHESNGYGKMKKDTINFKSIVHPEFAKNELLPKYALIEFEKTIPR